MKLEDSLGIPLKLDDWVHIINGRNESIRVINSFYIFEGQSTVEVRNPDNSEEIDSYSVNEIILTKLDVLEQNYQFN